jgi:hypothetical protein
MQLLEVLVMVDSEIFKNKVKGIVPQDYKFEFLGENFNQIVNFLTEIKAEKIYQWLEEVTKDNIRPIMVGSKKPYKDWTINQLLVFRYPFSINNTEYRILFVKIKNSIYLEFHLGDHKYYDKVRKDLDLKRGNY